MTKPKLIWFREMEYPAPSMIVDHHRKIWQQYFNIEIYDANRHYDKKNTVFISSIIHGPTPILKELRSNGHRVILDNLWEIPSWLAPRDDDDSIALNYNIGEAVQDGWYILECQEYFWYNEYVNNQHYENLRVWDLQLEKLALMPIRKTRFHRRMLKELAGPWLDRMIWSFNDENIFLPGDVDHETLFHYFNDRYVKWDWYNKTFCSVVSETYIGAGPWITEKTFKPIAYCHPFLIQACPGTLEYIKSLGFVTFDNIFDESYDKINDMYDRVKLMLSNLDVIDLDRGYDRETLDRIEHNRQHFWNHDFVMGRYFDRVIRPVLEYATS
jgi:hypothetical protein